jgi:hypothetical protein
VAPRRGRPFQLVLPDEVELEVEADVFTVSTMTIEARRTPTGTILAFNGTTEWALDAVTLDAVWLPRGSAARSSARHVPPPRAARRHVPRRDRDRHGPAALEHPDASEAYGRALLALIAHSR